MNPTASNLEDHLGYWLRFVSNHVSHAFSLKVESQGVTVAEWVVMRSLFDFDPVNPSQLANAIGLTRGAISKLIDRLTGKGLVICRADTADRRYQTVALSASGRHLVPVLAALADQNEREFFGKLSERDRTALSTVLKNIVEAHGFKHVPVK